MSVSSGRDAALSSLLTEDRSDRCWKEFHKAEHFYHPLAGTDRTTAVLDYELVKMVRLRAKEPWPNHLGTGRPAYQQNGGSDQRAVCFTPQFRSDLIAPSRRP